MQRFIIVAVALVALAAQARAQDQVTTETFGAFMKVANGTNVTVEDVNAAAWKQGVEFTSFTSVALTTKRKSSWSKANVTVTLIDDTTFTVTTSKKLISSVYLNITGAGNLTRKARWSKYFSSDANGTISGIFLVSVYTPITHKPHSSSLDMEAETATTLFQVTRPFNGTGATYTITVDDLNKPDWVKSFALVNFTSVDKVFLGSASVVDSTTLAVTPDSKWGKTTVVFKGFFNTTSWTKSSLGKNGTDSHSKNSTKPWQKSTVKELPGFLKLTLTGSKGGNKGGM